MSGEVKKPFYKKWWIWLIAVVVIIAIANIDDSDVSEDEVKAEEAENKDSNEDEVEQVDASEDDNKENEEKEEQPVEPAEPEKHDFLNQDGIPDPIIYEGSGDDVVMIDSPEGGPIVLEVQANAEERHFAVNGFDSNDNPTELFVNTTAAYEGITLDPSGTTTLLEISATGSWEISVHSIRSMRVLESPGSIEGVGDEVLLVDGDTTLLTADGNSGERHFAIKGYDPEASLIVNTTDVYSGTNRLAKDTIILEITAVGDWNLGVE